MFGYCGRIMTIDVTDSSFQIDTYDEAFARAYLGGNGFAARTLYDRLSPGIDPFDRTNAVVFAVGPVTDTAIPSTSRGYVASRRLNITTRICARTLRWAAWTIISSVWIWKKPPV